MKYTKSDALPQYSSVLYEYCHEWTTLSLAYLQKAKAKAMAMAKAKATAIQNATAIAKRNDYYMP